MKRGICEKVVHHTGKGNDFYRIIVCIIGYLFRNQELVDWKSNKLFSIRIKKETVSIAEFQTTSFLTMRKMALEEENSSKVTYYLWQSNSSYQ